MNKIILVRHGDPKSNSELSERGCKAIAKLAEKLKAEVVGTVCVLSSPEGRAVQSARIIGSTFGCDIEETWSLDDSQGSLAVEQLLEKKGGYDTIVMVTHRPNIKRVIGEGKVAHFSNEAYFDPIDTSTGMVIDVDKRTTKILRPY